MADLTTPPLNNRFTVDIVSEDSRHTRKDVAFSAVTGLNTCRLSLLQRLIVLFAPAATCHRLVLRRAVGQDHYFYDWHAANIRRVSDLRKVTIHQLAAESETPLNSWDLEACWVSNWRGPDFDAITPDIAYETVTLLYRKLAWRHPKITKRGDS